MTVRANNILKRFFVLMILISVFTSTNIMALEIETHKEINKSIAKNSFSYAANGNLFSFSLDDYLKNQLDMREGKDTKINNKKIFEIIGDGGEFEDNPPECINLLQRPRNHFHNPIDNSGYNSLLLSGLSAVDWINQPTHIQDCGWYSWNDVRSYFYYALKGQDKATRDYYFAETFRGLGQLMHLVQDMSVPEHTRNDGHIFFNYEKWVNRAANRNRITTQYSINIKYFTFDSAYPLNVENLFDTQQYDGTNPDITYNNNVGLSEYTNANFFGRDTIFKNFPYPALAQTELDSSGSYLIKKGHGETNGAGERIEHLACTTGKLFYKYLPASLKSWALKLDDTVYEEYASKLMPRAIGYSSQLLQYFFRGKLEAELGEVNGTLRTLKIKNVSNETIVGGNVYNRFELYYDNTSDVRTLLTSAQANTLAPGDEQTINFNMPNQEVKSFMLVYQGQLGNEPNAVIPLYIDKGGPVWVAGKNIFGCLGTGEDYKLINKPIPYQEVKNETITWTQEFELGLAANGDEWWAIWNAKANYNLAHYQELIASGCRQISYELADTIQLEYWTDWNGVAYVGICPNPAPNEWGTGDRPESHYYLYSGVQATSPFIEYIYKYTFNRPYGVTKYNNNYSISWPAVSAYKSINSPPNGKWASIVEGTSFIIDSSGNMYCAGGNIYGQLGIGEATGWKYIDTSTGGFIEGSGEAEITSDPQILPNYYSKTFIPVPGSWKMVSTDGKTTLALDSNGKLWVAGKGYTSTFTKYSDDVWLALFMGLYLIRETENSYEFYTIVEGGTFSLYTSMTKAEWDSNYPGLTPENCAAAMQGGGRTFIGGDYVDKTHGFNKPVGTLWLWNAESSSLAQLMPGTTWIFTAGYPKYAGPVIDNGGTIAIKATP